MPERAPETLLEVASYNVHRCVGLDLVENEPRVAAVIREMRADVVALQEVESDPRAEQPEYLSCATGYQVVLGKTFLRGDGEYGNAILCRPPILETRLLDLSIAGREPRGAIDVDLNVAGRRVRVINTHLGLAPSERAHQAERLLEALAAREDPLVVLLGDFNDWFPWGPALRRIRASFPACSTARTFPAPCAVAALDRVLVRPGAALRRVWVHRSRRAWIASDHLPLRASIDLGANGRTGPDPHPPVAE